jgi:hypothetical protein
VSVNDDDTYGVQFDDGDIDMAVPKYYIALDSNPVSKISGLMTDQVRR